MKKKVIKDTEEILMKYPIYSRRLTMIENKLKSITSNPNRFLYSDNPTFKESDCIFKEHSFTDYQMAKSLKAEYNEKHEIVFQVETAMGCLDQNEIDIIKMFYFKNKRIEDISAELGYTREHVSRMKKQALEKNAMVIFGYKLKKK